MSDDEEGDVAVSAGAGLLLKNDFIEALHADFTVHGADVIAACRVDDPLQYMKLIASLLPKDGGVVRAPGGSVPQNEFTHLSDQELLTRIQSLEAAIDASTSTPSDTPEAGAGAGGTQTPDRNQ